MTSLTRFCAAASLAILALAAAPVLAPTTLLPQAQAQMRHEQMWSSYDPGEIHGARGGRKLPTLVLGNPFPGPQEAVVDAVAQAMTGNRPSDQAMAARAPMRVLFYFNAATRTGHRICDRSQPAPVADTGPGRGQVELVATYCRGDQPMTQVTAQLDGVPSAQDPRFIDFIKQVVVSLFPPTNPDMNGSNFMD